MEHAAVACWDAEGFRGRGFGRLEEKNGCFEHRRTNSSAVARAGRSGSLCLSASLSRSLFLGYARGVELRGT